jgi:RNA polymerase sigma-B factor
VPLPEGWDPATWDNGYDAFEQDFDLERLFADLPPRERDVATLRYVDGLEHDQIAERLGIARNAVDQALWRAHGKLKEAVSAS